MRLVVTWIRLT